MDHRKRGFGVDLFGVGLFESENIPGELDHGHLHAKAKTQIWNFILAGVSDGTYFAFGAATTPPLGDDNAVVFCENFCSLFLDRVGIDPRELGIDADFPGGVANGFDDRDVGIDELVVAGDKVFADHCDF